MIPDPFDKNPFPPPQPPVRWLPLALLIPLIGLFALSDAAVLKLMEVFRPEDWGAFWVYLTAGGMCAQLGLLTIWGAIGLGRAWQRQILVMCIGSLWIGAWIAGRLLLKHDWISPNWRETAPAFCLPLVLLVMQSPLWAFRIFGRWRLAHDEAASLNRPPQMTIAGILGAMTLVGITLALVKLGLQVSGAKESGFWWIAVAVACASGALASLVVLVPVSLMTLRMKSWVAGTGLSVGYLLAVVTIAVLTASGIHGSLRLLEFRNLLALPTAFSGLAGGLLLPLVLIRLANYRLRWGRE